MVARSALLRFLLLSVSVLGQFLEQFDYGFVFLFRFHLGLAVDLWPLFPFFRVCVKIWILKHVLVGILIGLVQFWFGLIQLVTRC